MKNDFRRVARKIHLFSEQPTVTVITLQLVASSIEVKTNGIVTESRKYEPPQMMDEFLASLDAKSIKHEIIFRDDTRLALAVPRNKGQETWKAKEEFFSGPRLLPVSSKIESSDTLQGVLNTLLSPFTRERREVRKAVAKLNRA
jgi:hypothetical protein